MDECAVAVRPVVPASAWITLEQVQIWLQWYNRPDAAVLPGGGPEADAPGPGAP